MIWIKTKNSICYANKIEILNNQLTINGTWLRFNSMENAAKEFDRIFKAIKEHDEYIELENEIIY